MKAKDVMAKLKKLGCAERKGKGSHVVFTYGPCVTVVSNHTGDIAPGTLRSIEKSMEPVFGPGWLTGRGKP